MKLFLLLYIATELTLALANVSSYINLMQLFEGYKQVLMFGCDNNNAALAAGKALSDKGYISSWLRGPQAFIKAALAHSFKHLCCVVDLSCQHAPEVLLEANQSKLFSSPYKWILYNANLEKDGLELFLGNLTILVDSDVNIIDRNQSRNYIKIFKKHVRSRHLERHQYIVRPDKNFHESSILLRSRNQLNITLNSCIVVTNNDSLKHLMDKRDKHIDSIAKANYPIVLLVASIYNLTLKFSIANTWGYKDNNSEWSGMMGQLIRKEVDIGGTSLFFTKERIDLVEYIAMISHTKSKFVFRQPKLSYVTNVYTLPFDNKVWFSTLFSMVIMASVLFLAMKWEYMKTTILKPTQEDPSNQPELSDSMRDVLFVTLGALCQQSTAALPHSTPGRIVTLCLFTSLMFMYGSYSANIVALLQTSSNSIKSLEDLLNSRINVGVDDTVFNHFYFRTATEPTRKAIYEKKVAPPGKAPNFIPIEEGVRRMREGLFAFHVETGPGYKLVAETFQEDEKCGLQEIQYLQVVDPWLAIQKNSAYKEHLKVGFRVLQENGIQQRETNLIYTKKPGCTSKGSNFFSVGMVDCYAPAVILAAGMATSVVLFILEFYFHRLVIMYKTS